MFFDLHWGSEYQISEMRNYHNDLPYTLHYLGQTRTTHNKHRFFHNKGTNTIIMIIEHIIVTNAKFQNRDVLRLNFGRSNKAVTVYLPHNL